MMGLNRKWLDTLDCAMASARTILAAFLFPLLAGCAASEENWTHPTLGESARAQARAACETRAEEQAGPPAPLPRACGGEISALARDNCQREADFAYAQLAGRLRARANALSACLTEAGFIRQ